MTGAAAAEVPPVKLEEQNEASGVVTLGDEEAQEWYYLDEAGEEIGPFPLRQIREWCVSACVCVSLCVSVSVRLSLCVSQDAFFPY